MTVIIPDSHKDLLEKPIVVSLTTVSAEGKPYAVGIWRRWDGEYIRITSDPDNRKHRNILANPHVSVMAIDPQNPYRYLEIGGVVESIVTEGALEELNRHTQNYMGKPKYYGAVEPAERESSYNGILFMIKPERVVKYG
ncbi:MAG: pyridoxamine 5'-phosphate oxidase family protein [Chloroflexi bacterium]|nr:pyridoxamine 5'-phosphate oxidase family protein [Chloroflexota bacterium]MCC6894762.1 pyridoxamine 5'-phosphate oxidase family protein [Anaerolineae bacterium]